MRNPDFGERDGTDSIDAVANNTILQPSTSAALQVYLHEDKFEHPPTAAKRRKGSRDQGNAGTHRMFPFSCGVTSTESTTEPIISSENGRTEGFPQPPPPAGGIAPLQKTRILPGVFSIRSEKKRPIDYRALSSLRPLPFSTQRTWMWRAGAFGRRPGMHD